MAPSGVTLGVSVKAGGLCVQWRLRALSGLLVVRVICLGQESGERQHQRAVVETVVPTEG